MTRLAGIAACAAGLTTLALGFAAPGTASEGDAADIAIAKDLIAEICIPTFPSFERAPDKARDLGLEPIEPSSRIKGGQLADRSDIIFADRESQVVLTISTPEHAEGSLPKPPICIVSLIGQRFPALDATMGPYLDSLHDQGIAIGRALREDGLIVLKGMSDALGRIDFRFHQFSQNNTTSISVHRGLILE
ncbi:MAG: hypothetical protein AAF415_04775 [Pseudomonadota bacterium]